jgi:hypothetical protein
MPLSNYGVLKCTPSDDASLVDDDAPPPPSNEFKIPVLVGEKPHSLELRLGAGGDQAFRCGIDFHVADASLIRRLRHLSPGFTPLPSDANSGALDYVRGPFPDPRQILTVSDATNPSRRDIWAALRQAMGNAKTIYAFGVFDAKARRLHHIRANQGNPPSAAKEDGAYQDGGIFIDGSESSEPLTAFFFLGMGQSLHTEPDTAHPLPPAEAPVAALRDRPVHRPLKVYAFDPSRGKNLGNIMTVQVEYEPLRPGPAGKRVSVIDYDLSNDCFYEPVDLDDPAVLIRGGLDPSESDPRFHQQMVYAVVNETLRRFEMGYGRRLPGTSEGAPFARYDKLKVYPHAMQNSNAFYSRKAGALLFGYFPAVEETTGPNLPGQTIFTCLSHDVVAHETAHAVLERVRPHYCLPTNFEVPAFHEGFADLLALFHHFSYKEALRQTIQRTGGELHRFRMKPDVQPGEGGPMIQSEIGADNPLVELARQFGDATGMRAALRSALGTPPNTNDYRSTTEPHHQGSILVAAIFDAFFTVYLKRTADLYRIYRAGGGSTSPAELPSALADRVAAEASQTAEDLFNLCARALHYCPNVDITFGDFLRALVTTQYELHAEDPYGYRDALMQAFRLRGILPSGVRFFSEDALRWGSLDLPPCKGLVLEDSRTLEQDARDANRQVLTDYVRMHWARLQFEPMRDPYNPEDRREMKQPFGARPHPGDLKGIYYYRLGRNDELGYETDDLFVVMHQSWGMPLYPETGRQPTFHAVGGAVLVFAADGSVRYAISKGLRDPARLASMRSAYASMRALGLTTDDTPFRNFPALSFAAMHRPF